MSECVVKYNLYLDKLINAWWCLGVQLGGQYIFIFPLGEKLGGTPHSTKMYLRGKITKFWS